MKKFFAFVLTVSFINASFAQALVNNKGADIYVKDGGFMIVKTNSVANTSGTINNEGTITVEGFVQNGGQINGNGDTIRLFGDWQNDAVYLGNNSWVDMFGGNQLITGGMKTPFDNLNLGGGQVVKKQTIDASTANLLALNNAELATDVNEMLVINTSNTTITRNLGFVSSIGTGKLSWNTNSTNDYLFPVGSASYVNSPSIYRPVQFTPATAGNNTYGAALIKGDATSDSFYVSKMDDSLCVVNPNFYHKLYHSSGADAIALAMYFDQAADQNWTEQAHWENNLWNYMGPATSGSALGFSSVTTQGVSDFTTPPFALARKRFTIEAGPSVSINQGQSTTFNPVISTANYDSLNWSPPSGLNCPTCEKAVATPENTTTYVLSVSDGGCTVTDNLEVTVLPVELLVPTAFSPNNDGENDFFHILNPNNNLGKIDLQVFNRWGEKVFETTNVNDQGWDGTYKDIPQGLGVYVWQCQYQFAGTTKIKTAKGNVTLVR